MATDASLPSDLRSIVDRVVANLGPEERAIAERAIVEAVRVTSRKLAGEDVDEDVATLRATGANLEHRSRRVVEAAVLAYLQSVARALIVAAIA